MQGGSGPGHHGVRTRAWSTVTLAPATLPTCSTTATSASAPAPTRRPARVRPTRTTRSATSTAPSTVNPASLPTLTITASSVDMELGEAAPAITPSYSGLVGGDTAPATPPTCSTDGEHVEPDRPVRLFLLRCGRSELRHRLRRRHGDDQPERRARRLQHRPAHATTVAAGFERRVLPNRHDQRGVGRGRRVHDLQNLTMETIATVRSPSFCKAVDATQLQHLHPQRGTGTMATGDYVSTRRTTSSTSTPWPAARRRSSRRRSPS